MTKIILRSYDAAMVEEMIGGTVGDRVGDKTCAEGHIKESPVRLSQSSLRFGKAYLAYIWRCIEKERLHRVAFYDGGVRCFEDLQALLAPERAWAYCFERDGQVLALWWCNGFTGRMAQIHFCILEAGRYCGHDLGMQATRFILGVRKSLEDAPMEALCGITPAPYGHAVAYAKGLGFTPLGRLPKACYLAPDALGGKNIGRHVDGVLTILKREDCLVA